MLLEICANSYHSAKNAKQAGAHRIELCQALHIGGLTPSYGLLQTVLRDIAIPTFTLIRPRGGDFCYSDAEFDVMMNDITIAKKLGCHGIVSGILHPNLTIDIKRTRTLVEHSRPLPFTFHRAFDSVPNPINALNELIDLKVERILTSGQEKKAEQGLALLSKLSEQAGNALTILPGSGITPQNAHLFKDAGFREIHASASIHLPLPKGIATKPETVSDQTLITLILNEIA
jgi:copper homeostasis protein